MRACIRDLVTASPMPARLLWITLLLVAMSGCGVFEDEDDDHIVEGVDLDELFAPPRQEEIEAVETDWSSRIITAEGVRIVHEDTLTVDSWAGRMSVVGHAVGEVEHFGAIIIPDADFNRQRPVLVYLHGGDRGISINTEIGAVVPFVPEIRDDFILVIPSFRSESLRIRDLTFTSDGPASPWNYDVDDALSLLEVAFDLFPQADPDRVAALGFSRGATVAMLAAMRDPRIDGVVEFFGPSDFLGSFVRGVVREMLLDRPGALPGIDVLGETVLQPLQNGTMTMADARLELVRRSPVYFADRLPALQVHHWTADSVVPVSEAEALIRAVNASGADDFEPYIYEGGPDHSITFESLKHTVDFLMRIMNEAATQPPV